MTDKEMLIQFAIKYNQIVNSTDINMDKLIEERSINTYLNSKGIEEPNPLLTTLIGILEETEDLKYKQLKANKDAK